MNKVSAKISFGKISAAIVLLAVFVLIGCGKTSRVAWVYYDETRCDKWEYTNNNEVLKENVVNHFKGKGIRIYEIEIFEFKEPDSCQDCECDTGRRFKAKVKEKHVDEMKAEGFYQ